ncbi:MAG: MlaD family protein [Puniceicoccales bacterium]|jgi:paraquat-inducible protein B|nr:MlaD family protein [Puniceicoccales bacterium]
MSRRANPSIIGAFVLGGVLIFILAVGLFGSGFFNAQATSFICFFDDSVNGLDSGSPVKFKGVTIGKVSKVLLRTSTQPANDNAVPVIIEIDGDRLLSRGTSPGALDIGRAGNGGTGGAIRARLQPQSLITGVLFVELDYLPDAPARYHKPAGAGGLHEIPTVPSNFGTLVRSVTRALGQIEQIPFASMGAKADRILGQLESGVGALDFPAINKGVLGVTTAAQTILEDPAARRLPASATGALDAVAALSRRLDTQVEPTAGELRATAVEARRALEQISRASESIARLSAPGNSLRENLEETLRQIADAAAAVRSLANYVERRPNTLVFGKEGAGARK